jgi:hypothetical protein
VPRSPDKRNGAPTTETPFQQVPPGTAAIVPDAGDPRRIGELLGDWLAIQMDTVDSLVAEAESKVAVLPDQRHLWLLLGETLVRLHCLELEVAELRKGARR